MDVLAARVAVDVVNAKWVQAHGAKAAAADLEMMKAVVLLAEAEAAAGGLLVLSVEI